MRNNEQRGRVVIAGGSGFLGKSLSDVLLKEGYEVIVLTRNPDQYSGVGTAVHWDGSTVEERWAKHLEGAAALVNLTGKSVDCRPTKRNKAEILRSRVEPVDTLGAALLLVSRPPAVWVQAASLAIYGNAGDRICEESAFVPDEYPADICVS
ncbi:MAG: NAD-dependent epimerase/dehydratase family protein, partial [Verrucomicrobiales bacterium]